MDKLLKKHTIEQYYRIIDEECYNSLSCIISPEITFIRPGEQVVKGRGELSKYFRMKRKSKNTTHEILNHLDNTADSMFAKVFVCGELPSGEYHGEIISEFIFDLDTNLITRYKVYRGYDRCSLE